MNHKGKRLSHATCIIIFGCLMFAGCAEGPDRDMEHNIFVTHTELDLIEGDEVQITASPTSQTFTWESSNTAVATVGSTGLVRAVGDGACFIYVNSNGGLERTIPVDVVEFIPLSGIEAINAANLAALETVSMLLGQSMTLGAKAVPENYNERIPFNVIWKSDDESIVVIDEITGVLQAIGLGSAEITVSSVEKPEVKKVIPVEVPVIPITSIVVSQTSLELLQYQIVTLSTSFLPTDYSVVNELLQWSSSGEDIVKVTNGKLEAIGEGTATVTVSLSADPGVFTDIPVNVAASPGLTALDFSTFSPFDATQGDEANDFVYKKVAFDRGSELEIEGMAVAEVAEIYNRDFFFYNRDKNKFIFTGASGEWDVMYSAKYKYIWITRENDLRPACNWIMGANFASAPVWHPDFGNGNYSGQRGNPKNRAYMVQIRDGVYQAHILLDRASFAIMILRGWELVGGDWDSKVSAAGLTIVGAPLTKPSNNEMGPEGGFIPGYYKVTYDANNQRLTLEIVD
ncbi:MAG: Ig-like domain-containing protein [Bacteroidales bacterium]|nr:Ig-like domain-containing protein [Bacteroidales bacterium]